MDIWTLVLIGSTLLALAMAGIAVRRALRADGYWETVQWLAVAATGLVALGFALFRFPWIVG